MDIQISKWIIEFVLRQRVDDSILDRLVARLPLEAFDYRLKKSLLIRRIQTEVTKGIVSEKILDLLELVVELDFCEGKFPSETTSDAYCAVAVDCTVRFLELEDDTMYFETLQNIWKDRVEEMGNSEDSGLVTEKLWSWKDDLEAARSDAELREKILSKNTRYEALKAVKGYLAESWSDLGPSFLEKTAEDVYNTGKAGQGINGLGEKQGFEGLENVTEAGHGVNELGEEHGLKNVIEARNGITRSDRPSAETQHKQGPPRRKHVAVRRKILCGTGSNAKISNIEEEDKDTSKNKYHCFPTPEVNKMKADLKSSFVDLNAVVKDPLPEALKIAEDVSLNVQRNTGLGVNYGDEMNADSIPMRKTEIIRDDGGPEREERGNENQSMTSDPLEFTEESSPSRHRLQSPKRRRITPLKTYQMVKLETRRPPRKWSVSEEDTLRKGVKELGRGNWKAILMKYRDILEDRTEVDLKDKWRNLTRNFK